MEIIFCKQCGRRIKHDELQNNQFTLVDGAHFCVACMPVTASVPAPVAADSSQRRKSGSSAQIRPKTTSQSAVVRGKTGKMPAVEPLRPASGHQLPSFKAKPEKKPPVAIYVGIGLAAVAIIIAIVIFTLPDEKPPVPNNVTNTNPPDQNGHTTTHSPPDNGGPVPPPPNPGTDLEVAGVDSPELTALLNGDIDLAVRGSLNGPPAAVVCNAAATAPTLDGDLSDPCWAGAAVIDNFVDEGGTQSAQVSGESTTLRMVAAQGGVFVAGECLAPEGTDKMVAQKINRDEELWNEESVELFFLPPTARERYTQIIINPKGTLCDMYAEIGGERNRAANLPSLKTVVKVEPKRWCFELYVSNADLAGVPAGRWRFHAGRNRLTTGGKLHTYSWRAIGADFHNWAQWSQIEFTGAPAADVAAAHDSLRAGLEAYRGWRQTAAALKAHPLPLDTVDLPGKPRTVTLPFCPAMTAQDAGAAFDAPLGAISYFNTSAGLRPVGEVGFLRFGSLTNGTVAHIRLTARMTGGTVEKPRAFGLVLKTAPGAARSQMGVIGLVVVNSQVCAVALSRPEGSTMVFAAADKAPLWVQPVGSRPLDLDFAAEPGQIKMFVDGRLAALLPWPNESKTAADMVGLFTQNSGLDLYKFLASAGYVTGSYRLPPYGQVVTAPDLAGAPGGGLGLYVDSSAALGLAVATTQAAYSAGHAGQVLVSDSDLKNNPGADFKLAVHGGTPYRLYARIRNAGEQTGIAPKFWLQAGSLAGADQAGFAPGQAAAYVFQRITTNGHDWGWVPLSNPQTRLPVVLTFTGDTEAAFRLITGTPDTALDQVVLVPQGATLRGQEVNDDSCYIGGRLPPTFTLAGLQKAALTPANDVAALKYPADDGPPGTPNPPPGNPPTPATLVASADGFVSQAALGGGKILPATEGITAYPDQAGSKLALPPPLIHAHFFQASHQDWLATQGTAFSFELKNDAMVFLALDPAQAAGKAMLAELLKDGFERSSFLIQQAAPVAHLQVIRRRFPAGQVRFIDHNLAPLAPLVFVLPLDTTPRQPVDMTKPLEHAPGLPADSYAVQLHADELLGAVDAKKIATATLHKLDILPHTPLGQPAWVFHGIPASAGRNATDADAGYLTIADCPAVSRKSGALSFWVYLGGSNITKHTLVARKVGNQTKSLEIINRGLISTFGDRLVRAKEIVQPYKWTLIVWNFGPDGQSFIVDGKVEELQAVPADLSGGGELRVGNDYQKDCLEGLLAEFSVHDRTIESAKPPEDIPPALKLTMQMEKITDPGAVVIYGFDTNAGMPKEADLSGNGLDGVWAEYRGTVVGGQSATIGTDRDRVTSIKRGVKANPTLTLPQDPSLDLTSGSIYLTINLDKAALKKATGDPNRCWLVMQENNKRTSRIYFGDTLTNGFYFSTLNSSPVGSGFTGAGPGQVKANSDMEGGIWYRVAFTWTPKTLRYYQNGSLIEEKPNTGFKLDGNSQALVLFGGENDATRGFVGQVGQLKVYAYARSVWE